MQDFDVANKLRGLIQSSDRTPYRIAKDAGIDRTTVSRFMRGDRISLGSFQALVDSLNCELKLVKTNGGKKRVSPSQS